MSNSIAASPLAAAYERDGYFFPHDVTGEGEAAALLADFEAAEAEVGSDRARLSLLRSYPSQLLPSFAGLIRNPRLIEAVTQIIGPDVLVWSCGFFIKEAGSKSFVSWHQDLNYWGLDGDDEVTAWYALTPATVENACASRSASSSSRLMTGTPISRCRIGQLAGRCADPDRSAPAALVTPSEGGSDGSSGGIDPPVAGWSAQAVGDGSRTSHGSLPPERRNRGGQAGPRRLQRRGRAVQSDLPAGHAR